MQFTIYSLTSHKIKKWNTFLQKILRVTGITFWFCWKMEWFIYRKLGRLIKCTVSMKCEDLTFIVVSQWSAPRCVGGKGNNLPGVKEPKTNNMRSRAQFISFLSLILMLDTSEALQGMTADVYRAGFLTFLTKQSLWSRCTLAVDISS